MLYFFESELPENKSVRFALRYVFGIGKYQSKKICQKLGFSDNLKINRLKRLHKEFLQKLTEKLTIASDLKKKKTLNNNRLILIKSYRGLRRTAGLPVRGQRTHTNAKTARKKF